MSENTQRPCWTTSLPGNVAVNISKDVLRKHLKILPAILIRKRLKILLATSLPAPQGWGGTLRHLHIPFLCPNKVLHLSIVLKAMFKAILKTMFTFMFKNIASNVSSLARRAEEG